LIENDSNETFSFECLFGSVLCVGVDDEVDAVVLLLCFVVEGPEDDVGFFLPSHPPESESSESSALVIFGLLEELVLLLLLRLSVRL
jgi:hypothetical protein